MFIIKQGKKIFFFLINFNYMKKTHSNDAFLIEKLKHNLQNDLNAWIEYDELDEEEQDAVYIINN